ncbi:protein kinase, TKL group, partial [Reticulomyxa filosa]
MKKLFVGGKYEPVVRTGEDTRYLKWMSDLHLCVCDLEWLRHRVIVSIQVVGNPLPMAVGFTLMDRSMILVSQRKAKAEQEEVHKDSSFSLAQGRLTHVLHGYYDYLWQSYGSVKPLGFHDTQVKSIGACVIPLDLLQQKAQVQEQQQQQQQQHGQTQKEEKVDEQDQVQDQVQEQDKGINNEIVKDNEKKNQESESKEEKTESIKLSATNSFEYAFLVLLLHKHYSNGLPVLADDINQQLRSNLQLTGFGNVTINNDIKNTEFRKLARFVKHCEEQSWIAIDQKTSQSSIISVHSVLLFAHIEAIGKRILSLKYFKFTVPLIEAFIQWCKLKCQNQSNQNSF